ncbi:MAG: FG-GAP-like repeat-containing protein [Planctomycetota bacterium]
MMSRVFPLSVTLVLAAALPGVSLAQSGFELSGPFPVPPNSFFTHTAEVNGDGHLDLITGHGNDQLSLLLGDGSGGFGLWQPIPTTINAFSMASGDINGDGFTDLLVTNVVSTEVNLLLNDGSGAFPTALSIPVGELTAHATIADLDGDGNLDIAVTKPGNGVDPGHVAVLLGDGSGGFAPPQDHEVGANPTRVATGDFNGDGTLDLTVANTGIGLASNGSLSLLVGTGGGGFGAAIDFGSGHTGHMATGDFDEDGNLDVSAIFGSGGFGCGMEQSVFLGDGGGGFTVSQVLSFGCGPFSTVSGDFDGDGHVDLILTDGGDFVAAINMGFLARGDGSGTFLAPEFIIPDGLYALEDPVTGDFDEDGLPDLAFSSPYLEVVSVYLNRLEGHFIRGDANRDQLVDVSDPVTILIYLFASGSLECEDAADVNDSGSIDIGDAISLLTHLFVGGGPPPPAPFPDPGPDPTPDNLGC